MDAPTHPKTLQFFTENQGLVRFDNFMRHALYDAHAGYYSQGERVFGADGDFVTAPEISPLFGQTLARALAQPIADCGGDIWEFGAGRGLLARDLLLNLGQTVNCYHIVDVSGALQAQQRATLIEAGIDVDRLVRWERELPDRIRGVLIGNELLDAMPVRLFRCRGNTVLERHVQLGEQGLDWVDLAATDDLASEVQRLQTAHGPWPDDYQSEWPEESFGFVRTVTRLLEGVAVMIDYGFGAGEFYHPQRNTGTLVAHHRHRMSDEVLQRTGQQDITAHVNFSGVYEALTEAGGELLGYTSQAAFLLHHGLLEQAQAGIAVEKEVVRQRAAIQTLVNPSEMGELFKVMVWSRGVDPDRWPMTRTLGLIDRSRQL